MKGACLACWVGRIGSHRDLTMVDEKGRSTTTTIDDKRAGPQKGTRPLEEPGTQPRLAQPGRRPVAAPTTACSPEGKRRHAPAEEENQSNVVYKTSAHVAVRKLHAERFLPMGRTPARSFGKQQLGRGQPGGGPLEYVAELEGLTGAGFVERWKALAEHDSNEKVSQHKGISGFN